MTLLAKFLIEVMSCVIVIALTPSFLTVLAIKSLITFPVTGSRPDVGSSKNKI